MNQWMGPGTPGHPLVEKKFVMNWQELEQTNDEEKTSGMSSIRNMNKCEACANENKHCKKDISLGRLSCFYLS